MRLAIVAEGESELGGRSEDSRDGGASLALVRQLLPSTTQLHLVPLKISGRDLQRPDRRRPRGEAACAQLAYEEAIRQNCDGIVLFRDADSDADIRRSDNSAGLEAGAASSGQQIAAVLGLQINALEAWLLADAGAFERGFDRRRPDLPRRPEELWGLRRDPASNHPHQIYRRFLAEMNIPGGRRTMAALMEHADLDVLARECPDGFGRFKTDFESAFRPFACVVAADRANGIGKDNDLPWPRLKADLKHFRELTSLSSPGKRNAVIMGRRTWESVPEKYRPLPDRLNIVITRNQLDLGTGAVVAHSLDQALNRASLAPDVDRVFVIGGGNVYQQAFEHARCDSIYLTRLESTFECDAHMPDISRGFEHEETLARHSDAGLDYVIERWIRPRRVIS